MLCKCFVFSGLLATRYPWVLLSNPTQKTYSWPLREMPKIYFVLKSVGHNRMLWHSSVILLIQTFFAIPSHIPAPCHFRRYLLWNHCCLKLCGCWTNVEDSFLAAANGSAGSTPETARSRSTGNYFLLESLVWNQILLSHLMILAWACPFKWQNMHDMRYISSKT